MASFSIEHAKTQQQTDLLAELEDKRLISQHSLTVEEICDALEASQIHTCEHIVQIILESRRRIRREMLSQTVKNALKKRKSQNK